MIENLLIGNAWFALAAGVVFFTVTFYLAIYEAYLYHAGAKDYLVLEGRYEWLTAFQDIFTGRRRVSARFLAALLILALGILAAWEVCIRQYSRPDVFSFLIGGLLLLEAAAAMQHVRRIVLFRHARRAEGLQGKIEYSRRLVFTLSFVEQYSFAALYVLMFLVSGSWFFLGGALTCIVAGRRRRDWVKVFA